MPSIFDNLDSNNSFQTEDGVFTVHPVAPGSDQFEQGPNKRFLSLKTEAIRQSDKLNKTDDEIKKYFLFSKDPKENAVFLRNPKTNIVWKIEQQLNGKPNDLWMKSNLKIYVPELLELINSKMEMGERCDYTNDPDSSMFTLNAKVLNDMIDEAIDYFPIILRKESDRFGAYGRNYTRMNTEKKTNYDVCEEAKLALSCNGKSIDIYQALVNQIFSLKDQTNTIDTTTIKSYSLSSKEISFHKLNDIKISRGKEDSFVTKWLRNRLTEDEIDVLKAWIWGVFDARNKGRQLLYLYDPEGHAGKTTFLQAVFKPLMEQDLVYSVAKTDNSLGGRFDAYSYYDKRLLIWGDCKNQNFIKTSSIHALTGGDSIPVEGKGLRGFSYKPNIKLIVGSNIMPMIDRSARHETTRIILLNWKLNATALAEMTYKDEYGNIKKDSDGAPILHGDATIEEKLINALPEFYGECEVAYRKLCKDGCTIDNSNVIRNLEDVAVDSGVFYDEFFETAFEYSQNQNEYILQSDLECKWIEYLSEEKNDKIRANKEVSSKITDLINHLTKKGVCKKRKHVGGRTLYVLTGVRSIQSTNNINGSNCDHIPFETINEIKDDSYC